MSQIVYECITGHWCGEDAALTQERTCPLCGMSVTCETDAPAAVNGHALTSSATTVWGAIGPDGDLVATDEPVIVLSGVAEFDPMAITR